jgi:hypothetical protein
MNLRYYDGVPTASRHTGINPAKDQLAKKVVASDLRL